MAPPAPPCLPRRERAALALLAGLAVACMVAALAITVQVLGRLDAHASASRDDLQWTISQLEVDQVKFRLALERLAPDPADSAEALRRRFDLLYSRAMTLRTSPTYRTLLGTEPAAGELRAIVARLGEMLPLIDSTDAALLAGRARLDGISREMTAPIRALGFQAIALDARRADAERAALTREIVTLTTLSLVMLAALFALLVMLWRLWTARLAAEADIAAARTRDLGTEQARARFLGMISHEMRTPLNALLGALELLEDSPLSPEQGRLARVIRTSGGVLRTHVDEALDGLRAEAGEIALRPAPFDLDSLLQDLIDGQRAAAEARGNRLCLALPEGGLGRVRGDRTRLAQVLLNLLSNAIKFTSNGTVTLSAERFTGTCMAFRVADTGIGIPEADLPHVFEDFVRLPGPRGALTEGTGLGLGIARHLVTLMGGRIEARSRPGEGSLFTVRLSLPQVDTERAAHGPLPLARPLRVLVVEDTGPSRMVIAAMLARDGHKAILARDGIEGVARAGEAAVDLIVMDIDMPRLDGIGATRAIREGGGPNARTRIVALTAHLDKATGARLQAAGIDGIETKPLSRAALRALLHGAAITPPAPEPPLVDPEHLAQLADTLPEAVLAAALAGLAQEAETLLADLAGPPPSDLVHRLHRLAGIAATCGAPALHAHLARTERALADGRPDAAQGLLAALPALWQDTAAAFGAQRAAA